MGGRNESPLVVLEAARPDYPSVPSVLLDIGERSALELALRRLAPVRDQGGATLVVATTERPADDQIAELAAAHDAEVVRGPADDPLRAVSMASVRHGADTIVRLSASGPLVDPFVVLAAIDLHRSSEADYTSNLLPRSYPRGMDVEVLSSRALRACELEATGPQRRHATVVLRRDPARFRLASLWSGHDLAAESWALEDLASVDRLRAIVSQVPDPLTASWNRILAVAGRQVKPLPGDIRLRPLEPPPPGTVPWSCRWLATRDGVTIGHATLVLEAERTERSVEAEERWREEVRAELYRQVVDALGGADL